MPHDPKDDDLDRMILVATGVLILSLIATEGLQD